MKLLQSNERGNSLTYIPEKFSCAISRFGQVYTVTYFFLAAWPFVAAALCLKMCWPASRKGYPYLW